VLRLIFVVILLLYGFIQSLRGPFYGLLLYLAIAYFRPDTWIWGDQLTSWNISFVAGLYVILLLVLYRERLWFGWPVWLIALFCTHGLFATILSPHPEFSWFWWQAFAKVTFITILIAGLVNTEQRLRLALLVIVFALGFESVKQGWAYLFLRTDAANQNSITILGDNNAVAVGMLMLASVLLAFFQTSSGWARKGLFAFMLIGVFFRSLTTYSRGGLLAFAAMCIIYWARSKQRLRTAMVVSTFALILLPLMPSGYWNRISTISTDEEEMDSSSIGRLHFWSTAVQIANDHPLFGVGTNGFQASYDDYDQLEGHFGRMRAVHSTWFGILADQGYVGLFMLVGIMFLAFRACGRVRAAAKRAQKDELFAFAAALQAALVAVVVGGTFLSFHYVEMLWHFLGLSFALERVAVHEGLTLNLPAQAFNPEIAISATR
jgi:probable O-glycosylation ligase (exosortase A-associated)